MTTQHTLAWLPSLLPYITHDTAIHNKNLHSMDLRNLYLLAESSVLCPVLTCLSFPPQVGRQGADKDKGKGKIKQSDVAMHDVD